ncbi:23S ribosomal RNA methyltransferase Erm [Bowdeniella massiliensis]|uniref:23S ribosomal RNA methyltransferase Erm n=1 Tax=Bowdeniella massiliensis TaxID=2932264 RepID=UPI002028BFC5|nr:23S ribosomal RNA methyltransferase Erm [Bowdeniella massiliensis]
MPHYSPGRHEHGQNYLTDHAVIRRITHLVHATDGPIVEIGPGRGAITLPLARLDRPLTAVDIDAANVRELRRIVSGDVTVIHHDFLAFHLPQRPHVIVGNLPFHLTTAILRKLLHSPGWTEAILLVQWEVARRRARIGGASMMTAQWEPWFDFTLDTKVPAEAFVPRPSVDGGLLLIRRRDHPLLPLSERKPYQGLVHRVFTSKGRGLGEILVRCKAIPNNHTANTFLARHNLRRTSLPKDMPARAWVELYGNRH